MSAPAQAPTAAEAHSVAAVLRLLHDDASTEEADAGHHVSDHVDAAVIPVEMHGEIDERRGADSHQHVGTQARGALAILPFRADQGGEDEGDAEADHSVDEIGGLECRQEFHGRAPGAR
jgi:hypothetical protein